MHQPGVDPVNGSTTQRTVGEAVGLCTPAETVLDFWKLGGTPLWRDLACAAEHSQWATLLDTLLSHIATHPDDPQLYVALTHYSILQGHLAEAKLLLRAAERRRQLHPDWLSPKEYGALRWLLERSDTTESLRLAELLIEGPEPVRRAFLPPVLYAYRDDERPRSIVLEWLRRCRDEPEAWWTAVAFALERAVDVDLDELLAHRRAPMTLWQWRLAFRLACTLPEKTRWPYLAELLDQLHESPLPKGSLRQLLAELCACSHETSSPDHCLIPCLVATRLGLQAETCTVALPAQPDWPPTALALLAGLAAQFGVGSSHAAAVARGLALLLDASRTNDDLARTVVRLLPTLDISAIVRFALEHAEEPVAEKALALVERRGFPPQWLIETAQRLDESKHTQQAIRLLRLAARQARERNDRVALIQFLEVLAAIDPSDEQAFEFVVTHYLRAGAYQNALDLLVGAAHRLSDRGDRQRAVALLERAATLAELADDPTRLALIADLLATSEPDDPDRAVFAATAALRAGQVERARTHLWMAIHSALRHRRLAEALSAAEQLVGLAPHDEAARKQLQELRTLRERLAR